MGCAHCSCGAAVSFVTTDFPQVFAALGAPQVWTMSRADYVALFATVNVVCTLVVVATGVWICFKQRLCV